MKNYKKIDKAKLSTLRNKMSRGGLEPPALGLEVPRSIQLSYRDWVIREMFRSSDFGVMSPTRFHCVTLILEGF